MWNYETLKQLASEQGWRVGELLALAAKNDPFYAGRPAEMGGATWFAKTPIKESELRKAKFEESHGEGATELDALEALAILNYYDPALAERAREQKQMLASDLEEKRGETLLSNADELSDLEADYQALLDDFEKTRERFLELISGFQPEIDQFRERLEGIMARERQLYGEIRDGLEAAHVDPDDYPLPQPDLPAESDGLPYVFEVLRASGNGDNP